MAKTLEEILQKYGIYNLEITVILSKVPQFSGAQQYLKKLIDQVQSIPLFPCYFKANETDKRNHFHSKLYCRQILYTIDSQKTTLQRASGNRLLLLHENTGDKEKKIITFNGISSTTEVTHFNPKTYTKYIVYIQGALIFFFHKSRVYFVLVQYLAWDLDKGFDVYMTVIMQFALTLKQMHEPLIVCSMMQSSKKSRL